MQGQQQCDGGGRFRRSLSNEELQTVLTVCRAEGAEAGFQRLWDIILLDSEATTWADALARGLQFEPGAYCIPAAQADVIRQAMAARLGARGKTGVALAWLRFGPGTYQGD